MPLKSHILCRMLRNPGERWTAQSNGGPMPDNQPSDEGAGRVIGLISIYSPK